MATQLAPCLICSRQHPIGNCPEAFENQASVFEPKRPVMTWSTMTGRQRFLYLTGKVFAFIMAVGCGVQTGAAFLALNIMTAGAASFLLAGLIFLAGTAMNWYIFKTAVPEVLNKMFGKKLFQGLFEVEGGCELLLSDLEPTLDNLNKLALNTNAGYVRFKNKLFYVNKAKKEIRALTQFKGQALNIANFDRLMKVNTLKVNEAKRLSESGLARIAGLTGHRIMTAGKKAAMYTGIILALSVGITFGALTYSSTFSLTAAFGFLAAISPAFPPIAAVLAAVTLVCLTALMLVDIVRLIKTDGIGQKIKNYFKNMVDVSPSCEVHTMDKAPTKDHLNKLDIKSNAAYIRVGKDVYYVNKELNEISKLACDAEALKQFWSLKNGSRLQHQEIKEITAITGQKHLKSRAHLIAEKSLTVLLSALFLPLGILGLFMTMNACVPGVKSFLLSYIPRASAAVVNVVSNIAALFLAMLGQIPFTVKITLQTISNWVSGIFKKEPKPQHRKTPDLMKARVSAKDETLAKEEPEKKTSLGRKIFKGFLLVLAAINAIGNGLISMVGAAMSVVIQAFSGVGGTWNSYAAGSSSIDDSFAEADKIAAAKKKPQRDKQETAPSTPFNKGKKDASYSDSSSTLFKKPIPPGPGFCPADFSKQLREEQPAVYRPSAAA